MYHHGFAMLALAEAHGAVDEGNLWPDGRAPRSIGQALELAVRTAITSQKKNPSGAWRYSPDAREADTSVTGAVIIGLLAARSAGIEVPDESIGRAIAYLRPAVMDMGKTSRKSTLTEGHAPQARIICDKSHVLKHLGEAMDEGRRREYARLSGERRRFIKGRRYNLPSRREDRTLKGKRSLRLLFRVNRRSNKAYLLEESFGQLWDYSRPGRARRSFENWKDALKWQRLEPFRKFARMVEAHRDGIEAYCHEENKVPLGFVEGLNSKFRSIQQRAFGYRDEEYFRLKILTCMLPKL